MKRADARNVKLESAELFQCEEDGYFYIKLVYTYEAVDGIHKLIIPKISTMISNDDIPAITHIPAITQKYSFSGDELIEATFLNKRYLLKPGDIPEFDGISHVHWADKLIEPKPKTMTIEDIEKALGYPVKIVTKEMREFLSKENNKC